MGGWGGQDDKLMLHLWHLSLVSDVTLFCSVEVIRKFCCSATKRNSDVMWRWSTLFHSARAAINGNGSAQNHNNMETDREHRASRAAPSGQLYISNDSSLTTQSWPLTVLEYIIHCYTCVQYRIDKAIGTLKTQHKHKHTECIALNMSYGQTIAWSILIVFSFFFSLSNLLTEIEMGL